VDKREKLFLGKNRGEKGGDGGKTQDHLFATNDPV
jgi:hypothetical protein